ncbi:hypothetical protein AMK31_31535 [Streptomyces sp. TSRI0107]|nr:hypothetical protein AMK31_31535 [Streptomyces sp. TSRI0107]
MSQWAPRHGPGTRRTRRRHPQGREDPGQAALLPSPRDRDRAGLPRPALHRAHPSVAAIAGGASWPVRSVSTAAISPSCWRASPRGQDGKA